MVSAMIDKQRTLVIIKPDAVQRGLVGEVVRRFEHKGLKLIGLKLFKLPAERAEELYQPHRGKFFYNYLIKFMTSSPIVATCLEGVNAIDIVRMINGATKPEEAQPGSIRGDFSIDITHNVVHASDSVENAERELAILFDPSELNEYQRIDDEILYSPEC